LISINYSLHIWQFGMSKVHEILVQVHETTKFVYYEISETPSHIKPIPKTVQKALNKAQKAYWTRFLEENIDSVYHLPEEERLGALKKIHLDSIRQ
jgi:hypothetical protein